MNTGDYIAGGIFAVVYIIGCFSPKFRRYMKKNPWLEVLPGVLALLFFLALSDYLFIDKWHWKYGEVLSCIVPIVAGLAAFYGWYRLDKDKNINKEV